MKSHARRLRIDPSSAEAEAPNDVSSRRRIENALQAAIDALARGDGDEVVRRRARRFATTLDQLDSACESCRRRLREARPTDAAHAATCSACGLALGRSLAA
jgi:predicted nucleic acid-binding protein